MLQKLKDLGRPISQWIRQRPSRATTYRVMGLDITLPPGHQLPELQRTHPAYDRFLPHLCKYLSSSEWLIDVGANVGDTAAAMSQCSANPILAVEGSDYFIDVLRANAARMRPGVAVVHAMVGQGDVASLVVNNATTATRSHGDVLGAPTITLDAIVQQSGTPIDNVALIKVDTDGYDADVIMSGQNVIITSEPVLFWENYFIKSDQMKALEATYEMLSTRGYTNFWVFDNFGAPMFQEVSVEVIRQLNAYIALQNANITSRTIVYTDILACTSKRLGECRAAVSSFDVAR